MKRSIVKKGGRIYLMTVIDLVKDLALNCQICLFSFGARKEEGMRKPTFEKYAQEWFEGPILL